MPVDNKDWNEGLYTHNTGASEMKKKSNGGGGVG